MTIEPRLGINFAHRALASLSEGPGKPMNRRYVSFVLVGLIGAYRITLFRGGSSQQRPPAPAAVNP
jgi:hypothetical protein